MANFNRYAKISVNGETKLMPFIKIREKSTDKTLVWNSELHRMDILSQRYYGLPTEGWLIMMANPEFGTDEFDIPNGTIIRIPYPYTTSIQSFIDDMNRFDSKFGF
jgi:hypothetical protein